MNQTEKYAIVGFKVLKLKHINNIIPVGYSLKAVSK